MEDAGQLIAGLEHLVRHYGVVAIFVILALEAVGAPVPGETLLIFGSLLASRGEMSLPALLLFAWAGSVVGDNFGYLIGRKVGRATVAHYGAKVGLNETRYRAVERTFSRYGPVTVIFARFVNILRQLNGIVAGTLGMSWWQFLSFNAMGGALWVAVWVFVPFYFAEHMAVITKFAHNTRNIAGVLVAIAIMIGCFLLARHIWRN